MVFTTQRALASPGAGQTSTLLAMSQQEIVASLQKLQCFQLEQHAERVLETGPSLALPCRYKAGTEALASALQGVLSWLSLQASLAGAQQQLQQDCMGVHHCSGGSAPASRHCLISDCIVSTRSAQHRCCKPGWPSTHAHTLQAAMLTGALRA